MKRAYIKPKKEKQMESTFEQQSISESDVGELPKELFLPEIAEQKEATIHTSLESVSIEVGEAQKVEITTKDVQGIPVTDEEHFEHEHPETTAERKRTIRDQARARYYANNPG
jgi:hypothetical protein